MITKKTIKVDVTCWKCNKNHGWKHLADGAYGMSSTVMAGTERFVCKNCGHTVYAHQDKAEMFNFKYDKKGK